MSKFYLENEYSQRLDLQSDDYILMSATGLGVSNSIKYTAIGDMFVNNYLTTEQGSIKANILFPQPKAFDKLQKFTKFTLSSKKLYLVYSPSTTVKQEYRRDVDIKSFTQDTGKTGLLTYALTFECKSLFYINSHNQFLIERSKGEFRYNYTFPARFNDYASREIIFTNDGHVDATFTVQFNGYVDRPRIEVYAGNELINTVKFNLIIEQGEQLYYSSRDGDLQIVHRKANGTNENIINLIDIEQETFFKLPVGTSKIKFTSDTGAMSRIYLNVYKYYKVV